MQDDIIADQTDLIDLVQDAGWHVTGLEVIQYGRPWKRDDDSTEARIELTVQQSYGDPDQNPYRIK